MSGGCIEGAVIHEALEVMATGASRLLEFGVSDETAWEVGLACGGKVEVFVEAVAPERGRGMHREILEELIAARRAQAAGRARDVARRQRARCCCPPRSGARRPPS